MLRVVVVIALILLLALFLFGRWFQNTPPQQVAATLKRGLLLGLAAFFVLLAMSGRLHWVFGLLGGMLPLAQRAMVLWRAGKVMHGRFGRGKARNGGQTSQVQTRFLRMYLNHDTGALSGVVLEGHFKGRRLEDLGEAELIELLRYCQVEDEESARLLETYLDRTVGGWRNQARDAGEGRATAGVSGDMNREEAYQVLGLAPGASDEEIRAAHRRLMQKLHPDRGGSTYLAAKINQAKDLLLQG